MSYSLFHTLNISRQDMLSRLIDLDLISNNLANINTAGFKVSRANFQELLAAQQRDGTALVNTQMITLQGPVNSTNNPLDWAIQGEGFFQVRLPNDEIGYTRDGAFRLDTNGELVNSSGYRLEWEGDLPEDFDDLEIHPNGEVVVVLPDGTRETVGTIELARFPNPTALLGQGLNLWLPTEASGEPETGTPGTEGFGIIMPRSIEQSNVDLALEMTHLMTLQRAFQLAVRTFQQTDTMINQAIHMRKA